MTRFILIALLCLSSATAQAQGIPLDRLNKCDDMASVSRWLGGTSTGAQPSCRPPRDALEKRLLADWASSFDTTGRASCMTTSPVLASLRGFDCMVSRKGSAPTSFFCFRRYNSAPLQAYRENYAQVYARRVADYFAQSGKCDGVLQSGHKARIAGVSMPSSEMLSIATPAFGYESRLRSGGGLVEHGFSLLDPSLATGGKGAIEYLSASISGAHSFDRVVQRAQRTGEWTIDTARIDDAIALANAMAQGNATLKASLKASSAAAVDFDIGGLYLSVTSPNRAARTDADKVKLRKAWLENLGASLRSWKIDPVNSNDLRKQGLDPSVFENGLSVALPYGLKGAAATVQPTFAGAWAGEQASCGTGHGGYLVLALDLPPAAGRRSEFGTLALTVMAVSSCRAASGGPGIGALMTRITNAYVTSISGT